MTRDVLVAIDVHAEPKVVYDTISSPEGLAAFWTPDVRSEGSDGSELSFGFEAAPTRLPVTVTGADGPKAINGRSAATGPHGAAPRRRGRLSPASTVRR